MARIFKKLSNDIDFMQSLRDILPIFLALGSRE